MAKIAITGSNGFVGGNIAKVLQLAGHEVIGLVRSPQQNPLPWATTVVDLASIEDFKIFQTIGTQRKMGTFTIMWQIVATTNSLWTELGT